MRLRNLLLALTVVVLAGTAQVVQAGPTLALYTLTNIAKITAANSPIAPTNAIKVTTATMYGGKASVNLTPVLSINNFGSQRWNFTVTNFGNAVTSFTTRLEASNCWFGGGKWARHIEAPVLTGIGPYSAGTFQFVVSNTSPASNGAYVGFLIKISNKSAQSIAHAYFGADGVTWYGGSLGILTNNSKINPLTWNGGPVVYLQNPALSSTNWAGFLTAILRGPSLRIVKSIAGIWHPANLAMAAGYAEPGAFITNRIWVTNSGSSYATNVKIMDTMTTNFSIVLVQSLSGSFSPVSTNLAGGVRVIRFSNTVNNRLDPATYTVLKIVVKVK